MITTDLARMLTRYKAWANEIVFSTVAALPEGEATKPRPTLFKNMVHTLNHPYVIDRIFQATSRAASTGSPRATRRPTRRSTSCGTPSSSWIAGTSI